MVAEHGFPPPPQERIPERTCEQVVDVRIRLVVEQVLEVPKNSSQDRNLQGTVEQIPENSVLEKTEQLVKVPETVSRNGVQQRTVDQIVDASVPQAVEELAEVSKVFSQDGIQQRIVVPVIHIQRTTQRGVNTHAQHVVNAVEVEKPKSIKETAQRKKPITQEKINQETKPVERPQAQFSDKAGGHARCCTTTGVHGPDSAESNGGSTAAVHRQSHEHPCRGAETNSHGPDYPKDHGDSTVAVSRRGDRCPCCVCRAGSTCARRGGDSRDPMVAVGLANSTSGDRGEDS